MSKFTLHQKLHLSGKSPSFIDVISNYLSNKDSFVFVDGGAGFGGVASRIIATCNQQAIKYKAHLVEPLPENWGAIGRKIGINSNVTLHKIALAEKSGLASFTIPFRFKEDKKTWQKGSSASGFIGESTTPGKETISVSTERLDDIVKEKINLIKLDLQGGEFNALLGAKSILNSVDIIYLEHIFSRNFEKIYNLVKEDFEVVYDMLLFGCTHTLNMPNLLEIGIVVDTAFANIWSDTSPLLGTGYFLDERWDFTNWTNEQALLDAIKKSQLNWMQMDAYLVNKRLDSSLLFQHN